MAGSGKQGVFHACHANDPRHGEAQGKLPPCGGQSGGIFKFRQDSRIITLGDPTVYSTYMYVHKLILEDGFEAEIISGVTSFCAAAARLNISLAERAEMLHVVPSSHGIEKALDMPGTKVLMKAGSKMALVKEKLLNSEMNVMMVENCGIDTERVFRSASEIPENAGYFSLIIAKDRK